MIIVHFFIVLLRMLFVLIIWVVAGIKVKDLYDEVDKTGWWLIFLGNFLDIIITSVIINFTFNNFFPTSIAKHP